MLTGPQKRFLRKEAHSLQPIFQVGKGGVNPNMVSQISDALLARELLKVSVLQNCEVPKEEVAKMLSERTGSELVQVIGRTIILYKESSKNKQIELP